MRHLAADFSKTNLPSASLLTGRVVSRLAEKQGFRSRFSDADVSAALFSEQGGHSGFGVPDSSLPGSAGQGALEVVPGLLSRAESSEWQGATRPRERLFPRAVTLWPPCLGGLVGVVPCGVISLPWPRTCPELADSVAVSHLVCGPSSSSEDAVSPEESH